MRPFYVLCSVALILSLWSPSLYAACTCHSKCPEMVKMHDELALEGRSCFLCHGPGNKLIGGEMPSTPREIGLEPLCVKCHG